MQSKFFFNVILYVKKPYFKDPLRFLFWTFLDILKMSIFGFLEEIFFGRTEKSGNIVVFNCRIGNGKEIINYNCAILIISKNDPLKIGHF